MTDTTFFEPGTINVYASIMIPDVEMGSDFGYEGHDWDHVSYDACFIEKDSTTTWTGGTQAAIISRMLNPKYNDFKKISSVQPDILPEGTKHRVLENGSIIAQKDRDVFMFRNLNLEERVLFGIK